MKKYCALKTLAQRRALTICMLVLLSMSSCGSLEQWSAGLQAVGDSLSGAAASYYSPSTTNVTTTPPTNSYSAPASTGREWHNCSTCGGSGRCKSCGGSGANSYSKNGRCGVCRGSGKCAACNGKGGWYI